MPLLKPPPVATRGRGSRGGCGGGGRRPRAAHGKQYIMRHDNLGSL